MWFPFLNIIYPRTHRWNIHENSEFLQILLSGRKQSKIPDKISWTDSTPQNVLTSKIGNKGIITKYTIFQIYKNTVILHKGESLHSVLGPS